MFVRFIKAAAHDFIRLYRYWQLRHNPVAYAASLGVHMGTNCQFFGLQPGTFGSEPYLVKLGNNVYVTSGVRFITHDGGVLVFRDEFPSIDVVSPIVVEDNVFIGTGATIMPGVTIGTNSVIGAGAVVTRAIPPGTVAAGVPARRICGIQEYRSKIQARALHIAQLSPSDKRTFLESYFAGEMGEAVKNAAVKPPFSAREVACSVESAPRDLARKNDAPHCTLS